MERYTCQIQLRDFGIEAQQRLQSARVLVIGAGGLGCPALLYMAGAGVGTIGVADDDVVQIHNLHRQVLFTTEDAGNRKAEAAAIRLQQLNPEIKINTHPIRITCKEALSILPFYDIILDGSDNFATRFMINDACVLLNKPLVYGAVAQTEGQVGIFTMQEGIASVNYRDLFPDLLPEDAAISCREQGIFGLIPGIIGLMMATETIKLITQKGRPLANQMLSYNCFSHRLAVFDIKPSLHRPSKGPHTPEAFEQTCYVASTRAVYTWKEIDGNQANDILSEPNAILLDVREADESEEVEHAQYMHIPLYELQASCEKLRSAEHIIVACAKGIRSKAAAQQLYEIIGDSIRIYALTGGIHQWKDHIRIFL